MRIEYSKVLIIMEIIGVMILLAILIATAYVYPTLPDRVPTHFNALGEADRWGGKGYLWFVPAMSVFLYLLITIAGFFPKTWNYPSKIDPSKLPLAEKKVRNLLMIVKLIITAMFGYIQYMILKLSGQISFLIMILFTAVLFGIIIYYIVSLSRLSVKAQRK